MISKYGFPESGQNSSPFNSIEGYDDDWVEFSISRCSSSPTRTSQTNDLQQRCLLRCFNFNENIPDSTKIQNKTKLLDGHIISDFSDYYEFMSKDPKQNLNLKISQGFKNLPFKP